MTYMQSSLLTDVTALFALLGQKRPSRNTQTYSWFRSFLKANLSGKVLHEDKAHNFWVVVPHANGMVPKHAMTSHYDTVHREFGSNEYYMDANRVIFTDQSKRGTPLGADDGAGVFIMLELIKLNVPGVYLFFADEECGGIGSGSFDLTKLFGKLDIMLSLDRAGFDEVICSQAGEQSASEDFGNWLADSLNQQRMDFAYAVSHDGVFTDSANFIGSIPECANLSVGYSQQHTKYETLHLDHVLKLIETLAAIDFTKAPVGRPKNKLSRFYQEEFWIAGEDAPLVSDFELLDYVISNPQKVAAFLERHQVTVFEMETRY